jgi:hypothetical protein
MSVLLDLHDQVKKLGAKINALDARLSVPDAIIGIPELKVRMDEVLVGVIDVADEVRKLRRRYESLIDIGGKKP